MLLPKFRHLAFSLAVAASVAAPSASEAGPFGDMISGGMGAARSVARRGADVAKTTAVRSAGAARSAASRGTQVARSAATRGVNAAQQATARGVIVAQAAGARGATAARNVASRGVEVAQQVGTRGVNAAGSAVNRARLAQNAIQNRLNPGGGVQNLVDAGNGAVAAGVARFAGATQITAAAPQQLAGGVPQGIVGNLNPAQSLKLEQLKSNVSQRIHNAENAVAAIPPKLVDKAGQVAGAAGLPPLPPRVKTFVNDVAALPQIAANIPVGAVIKSKFPALKDGAGQGQLLNGVAAAGGQAIAGNGLVGDALQAAGAIPNGAINPANGLVDNGGVIDAALAGSELAAGIVETVDAAQPDLLAAAIPAGTVRSIVANRPVSGGGMVAAPAMEYASVPAEEAFIEAAPAEAVETFAAMSNADLVLEDLQLVANATAIAGPAYRVQFRNQGSASAGDFYVVVLAGVAATPTEDAPRAVLHVASVAPGEAVEAVLRLPAAAMRMTDASGAHQAMTHLFVSLDFTDAIAEVDETNNLAVVETEALTTAMR
ncbi:hypothetical protein [Lacipirellula sp.]|uniref:hypothetical protein n=1 Tax=Lacipirellula sp. TaxID=2691419 RepID=UPI003D106A6D